MVARYEQQSSYKSGTATTTIPVQVAFGRPFREFCLVENPDGSGSNLLVQWGKGETSSSWGYKIIKEGGYILFSRKGDLDWRGDIYVTGSGASCVYKCSEVWWQGLEQ